MAEIKSTVITEISGKVGDLVFYTRGRKNFVRKWVKPHDPKTPEQLIRREKFADLVRTWQSLTAEEKKSWKLYPGRKGSPYNAFMSENLKRTERGEKVVCEYTYTSRKQTFSLPQYEYSLVTTSVTHEYSMKHKKGQLYRIRNGPFI